MRSCVTISLVEQARGGPFVFWHDLPGAFETAAELGFNAVEVFAPSAEAIDVAELQALSEAHGLPIAALGTGGGAVIHGWTFTEATRRWYGLTSKIYPYLCKQGHGQQ